MLMRFYSPQLRVLLKGVAHLRLPVAYASSGNKSSGPKSGDCGPNKNGDKEKGEKGDKGKKNGPAVPPDCGPGKKAPTGPPDCEPVKEPECEPPKEPECEPPKEPECTPQKDPAQDCPKEPECEPQKKAPDCEPQKKAPDCEPQKKAPDCEPQKKAPDCEPQKKAPDCEPPKKPAGGKVCTPPRKSPAGDCGSAKKAAPEPCPKVVVCEGAESDDSEKQKSGRRVVPPGMVYPPGIPQFNDNWDFINYPRISQLQRNPPVRFGFIPKAWFDAFYKKTGVSGGYMFFFACGTYLFSKEMIVMDSEFYGGLSFLTCLSTLHCKLGQKFAAFMDKKIDKEKEEIDANEEMLHDSYRSAIDTSERRIWEAEGIIPMLAEARRENVMLQMEAAYRSYLSEVYVHVKEILDFHAAMETTARRFRMKNMYDYVVGQSFNAVSPKVQSVALEDSIATLKNLTPTA